MMLAFRRRLPLLCALERGPDKEPADLARPWPRWAGLRARVFSPSPAPWHTWPGAFPEEHPMKHSHEGTRVPLGCGGYAFVAVADGYAAINVYTSDGRLRRRTSFRWDAPTVRASDPEIRHIADGALARSVPRPARRAA